MKSKKFDMLKQNTLKYSAFFRVTKKQSKNKIAFWNYRLVNILSESEKNELLAKYNNIAFGLATHRYAPEIKYTTLLQFDKSLITISPDHNGGQVKKGV